MFKLTKKAVGLGAILVLYKYLGSSVVCRTVNGLNGHQAYGMHLEGNAVILLNGRLSAPSVGCLIDENLAVRGVNGNDVGVFLVGVLLDCGSLVAACRGFA